MNNLSHEAAVCAAYFSIVANAPGLPDSLASGLALRGAQAFEFALSTSDSTRAIARLELAAEGMGRTLDGTWENLALINRDHGYACRDLLDDPARVIIAMRARAAAREQPER